MNFTMNLTKIDLERSLDLQWRKQKTLVTRKESRDPLYISTVLVTEPLTKDTHNQSHSLAHVLLVRGSTFYWNQLKCFYAFVNYDQWYI